VDLVVHFIAEWITVDDAHFGHFIDDRAHTWLRRERFDHALHSGAHARACE